MCAKWPAPDSREPRECLDRGDRIRSSLQANSQDRQGELAKMHKGIDWDDLRLALAIARGEGLSGAARSLGINHATVFRRLNQLERRIGVRLFERFRTGYSATSAGNKVVALAGRVESGVVEVTRELSG